MQESAFVNNEVAFDVKKVISKQLDALRVARGFRTIKELAEEIGVIRYETFNSYASGKVEPKAAFFAHMHEFGINIEWLITGEGEMYRANRADVRQDVAVSYARDSNVVTTGVNNGHIVAEVGLQRYNTDQGGRGQRLCEWIADYAASHSDADVGCLMERMRRAFPEFEGWERK